MRILLNALFLLLLFGCGGGDGDNDNNLVNNDSVLIRSIQISVDNAMSGDAPPSIPLGTALKYQAIGSYSDGTTRNITTEVAWKSSDATVVTIDRSGAISTLKEGSIVINANLAGVQSNSFSLTITPAKVTQVQISTISTNIAQGTTQNLLAMATMTDQSTKDVSALVLWKTSDAEVLSIDDKGVASAVARGSVVVNAEIDGVKSNNLQFVVTEGVVVSLQISPANSSVAAGLSSQFTAIAAFSDGRTQDVTTGATWSSSDSAIVVIDTLGLATGVKEGVATVSATFNDISSNNATLAVTSAIVTGVQVTPAVLTLFVTTTRQFTAIATLSDNSTQNVSSQATWATSDAQIATINSTGVVTGVAEGVITISATVKGVVSNSAKVTIAGNRSTTVTQVQITPSVASIAKGTTRQFTAIARLADNTTQDVTNSVTWNSSAVDVSTINASGLAKGLTVGNAVITATFNGVTSNDVQLSITAAQVSQMQITPSVLTLASGTHKQLVATATFTDGTTQDVTTQAAWISSDLAVATVDITGDVTAVTMGATSISASLNGVSASAALTVSAATVSHLQVSAALGSIAAGTGTQFNAIATYSDNTTQDVSSSVAWNSDNTSVVTVDANGYAVGGGEGQAIISAIFQGVTSNQATLDVTAAVVSEIQISIPSSIFSAGTGAQLMAVATFSDNSSQNVTSQVAWLSGDVNLATVNAAGMLTTVKAGNVNVTASLNGVTSNSLAISITSAVVTQLVVTAPSTSFAAGTSTQLTGTAYFSDGSTQDVSSQMSWSSTNTGVVTVDANGLASGITSGSTSVSGRFNGVNSNVLSVNVSAATLSAIQISPAIATIAKGTNSQFTAIATYSDNSSQDITAQVSWDSSATAIVTINAAGLAKGVGVGAATIKANLNGVQSNSATLTVSNAVVTQLQLSPTSASIAAGTSRQFLATATYSDGSTQNLSNLAAWRSSDTAVATVNGSGLVQGAAPGNATIQASIGGVTASVPLSVTAATVSKVQISASLDSVAVGTTSQFTAIATFTDSSTQDVTNTVSWTSDDTAVASIQANGLAKGLMEGDANISATFGGVSSNSTLLTVTAATATQLQISATTNSLSAGTTTQLSAIATFTDGSTQNVSAQVAWNSSSTSVATVSVSGLVTGVAPGNTVISGNFGGIAGNNLTIGVTSAVVTQLVVTAPSTSFAAGTSTQLTGTAYFSDGSTQDVSSQMSWSSTNTGVVTVDANGLASGITSGSTSVSGRFNGVNSNVLSVNVSAATLSAIQISPAIATIAKGSNSQFTALATYSDNSSQDVTTQVAWDSSATAIVTINAAGLAKGVGVGAATIKANLNGVQSNSATLTVSNAVVTQLQLSPTSASIAAGTSRQFLATATYSDGSTQNLSNLVAWRSSDTAVATVNGSGLVQGAAPGNATIQASIGGVTASVPLSVTAATVSKVQISASLDSVAVGTTSQFTAIATFTDSSTQDVTNTVSWTSDDTAVAPIQANGLAKGLMEGDANISATFGGVSSNSTLLTVTAATATQLQISATTNSLSAGTTTQLSAIATFTDGSTQNVSAQVAWNSSSTSVATVSASGLVTGVTPGNTVISGNFGGIAGNNLTIGVTSAVVTQLVVTAPSTSFAAGTSTQLTGTAYFSDGSTQDVSSQMSWSSTNTGVVTVDTDGLATGALPGSANIGGAFGGIASNIIVVNITAATLSSIQISPAIATIAKGTNSQFTAIATYSDDSSQDVTTQVSWDSNDTDIVTITANGLAKGVLSGQVSVSAIWGGVVSNTATITVTAAIVTQIQVTPSTASVAAGTSRQFTATATYSDGSTQNLTNLVSWNSSNTATVTINTSGLARGVLAGSANIQATKDGVVSNVVNFNITAATLTSLQISPASASIAAGTKSQFTAIGTYSDGSNQILTSSVNWDSSAPSIASIVSNTGLATGVAIGTTTIKASLSGVTSNLATLTVTAATVTQIQVTPTSSAMAAGTTKQLTAIATLTDGRTQDISTLVAWLSVDPQVVTVSPSGVLTAVMPGSTTVTASFSGVVSNAASVTTTAATVTQLQVTPAIVNLALGTSQQLNAIATYTDSSTQVVTSLVSWESSAAATASVDPQGLAMAASVGQAVIKAKLNGVDSNTVTLTVTAAVVNSLAISPTSASLAAGTTKQFMATATFSDTSVQDLTEQVTWSSSDTSVATILPSGIATAETAGSTTITAAINGVVASVPMTVTAATVSFINISTDAGVTTLPLGASTNISASAIYSDDSIQDITHLVSWAIDTDAVTVNALGVVEAANIGTADVTATLGSVTSDPITFTVTNAVVSSLAITPATASLALGNRQQYIAIATYSDATSLDVSNQVSWNSSNLSAATISINGSATAVALGSATITASLNGIVSNSASLSVTSAVLNSIVLSSNYNGTFITILGSPIRIIAKGVYSDGSEQVLTSQVIWQLSRAGVITITGLGDLQFETTSVLSAVDVSASYLGISSVNYMSIDCLASVPLLGTRVCTISSTNF